MSEENVGILRQGAENWNRWRQEHPDKHPNFSGSSDPHIVSATAWNAWRKQHPDEYLNLSGADLSGAALAEADLSGG